MNFLQLLSPHSRSVVQSSFFLHLPSPSQHGVSSEHVHLHGLSFRHSALDIVVVDAAVVVVLIVVVIFVVVLDVLGVAILLLSSSSVLSS